MTWNLCNFHDKFMITSITLCGSKPPYDFFFRLSILCHCIVTVSRVVVHINTTLPADEKPQNHSSIITKNATNKGCRTCTALGVVSLL